MPGKLNESKHLSPTVKFIFCAVSLFHILAVAPAATDKWEDENAKSCITFTLREEASVPRKAELVTIKVSFLLKILGNKHIPTDSLSLYSGSEKVPLQSVYSKIYPAGEEREYMKGEDSLIFCTDLPANGQKVFRLYLSDKKSPGNDPYVKKNLKYELINPDLYPRFHYDMKVSNSIMELKIRAGNLADEKRRNEEFHHDNACIVGLTYNGKNYPKIAFPQTGMENIKELCWGGIRILENGPVRFSFATERDFKSFKYPHVSNWAVFSKDRAIAVKGTLSRTFSISSDSPVINIEDRYELENPEKNFVVSYKFSASCGPLASREFIVSEPGALTRKSNNNEKPVIELDPKEFSSGWLAQYNSENDLGLVYIFKPEKIYGAFIAFNYPWIKNDSPLYKKQEGHLILRTGYEDFFKDPEDTLSFKIIPFSGDIEKVKAQLKAMENAPLNNSIMICGLSEKGSPFPENKFIDRNLEIRENLDKAQKSINEISEIIQKSPVVISEKCRQEMDSLSRDILELKNSGLKSYGQFNCLEDSKSILNRIISLKKSFDIFKARLFLQDKNSGKRGFSVFAADSMNKIREDGASLPKMPRQEIEIELAKNERESFQLAVIPNSSGNMGMRIELSDFTGPDGVLISSDENFSIYRVIDVKSSDESRPDALVPVKNISGFPPLTELLFDNEIREMLRIKDGRIAVFWFTVYIPPGYAAGTYKSYISLNSDSGRMEVPVQIKVFDFEIPKKRKLKSGIWFSNDASVNCYYGRYAELSEFAAMVKYFASYRLNSQLEYNHMFEKLKISSKSKEEWYFDFSEFTPWLKVIFDNGCNWFNSNMGCGAGWTGNLGGIWSRQYKVYDRDSGKTFLYPEEKKQPSNYRIAPDKLVDMPIFKSFWKSYAQYLEEHGWLDKSYLESVDEPPPDENKERSIFFKKFYSEIRKINPRPAVFNYGVGPSAEKHSWAEKYTDVWGPLLKTLDDEKDYLTKQKAEGRPFITYVCGSMRRLGPNHTPDVMVQNPGIDLRMVSWMVYKYAADGILFFAAFPFRSGNEKNAEDKRWPASEWILKYDGVGTLIYPAPKKPIFFPSIRLENIRDGLEDYEYLKMLESFIRNGKGKSDKSDEELLTLNSMIESAMNWDNDPEKLRNYRRKIAESIEKFSKDNDGCPLRTNIHPGDLTSD